MVDYYQICHRRKQLKILQYGTVKIKPKVGKKIHENGKAFRFKLRLIAAKKIQSGMLKWFRQPCFTQPLCRMKSK
jgi:hypothetical protein